MGPLPATIDGTGLRQPLTLCRHLQLCRSLPLRSHFPDAVFYPAQTYSPAPGTDERGGHFTPASFRPDSSDSKI